MPILAIRLDPRQLENPDTDLRYVLPDLLVERSAGLLSDGGWEYAGNAPFMVVYMQTSALQPALALVLDVIQQVPVMDNWLHTSAVVAVEADDEAGWDVVYPVGHVGGFLDESPSTGADDDAG